MLSVVILTKNEEDLIKNCLESVKWADEIIVVDEDSKDNTIEIAKRYTDKVFIDKTPNFSKRRNLGMEKARGDWVLYVDADERVLRPLRNEINELINSEKAAFAISRRTVIFGQEKRYGVFWPSRMVRLIKKSSFKGWKGEIHEHAEFDGNLGYTKNSLIHLTHRDLDQIVLKSLDWSNIDAKLRLATDHPKMSGPRFIKLFVNEVFNQGIKQRGFFNGTVGVMDSLLQIFSLMMTYIRLWQLQQPKLLKDVYKEIDEKLLEDGFDY